MDETKFTEKVMEDILFKYPDLIETDLVVVGRQINAFGKRADLVCKDKFGDMLIIEIKAGIVKREAIAQIFEYEGLLADKNNPTRLMLIGNIVPLPIRNCLERHGMEWRELSQNKIGDYLKNKDIDWYNKIAKQDNTEEGISIKPLKKEIKLKSWSTGLKDCELIPPPLLNKVYDKIKQKRGDIPFKCRGIMITDRLIKVTMELLNKEPEKMLLQLHRNEKKERTPDGLDRRIKEALDTDLRTANIISDVLEEAGIVNVIRTKNPKTGRIVKGTKLNLIWSW